MPARLRDLARVLATFGVTVEEPRTGSHWKCRRAGDPTFPIPAHNGMRSEVDDPYLRALCRHFAIDFDDFKSKL